MKDVIIVILSFWVRKAVVFEGIDGDGDDFNIDRASLSVSNDLLFSVVAEEKFYFLCGSFCQPKSAVDTIGFGGKKSLFMQYLPKY